MTELRIEMKKNLKDNLCVSECECVFLIFMTTIKREEEEVRRKERKCFFFSYIFFVLCGS